MKKIIFLILLCVISTSIFSKNSKDYKKLIIGEWTRCEDSKIKWTFTYKGIWKIDRAGTEYDFEKSYKIDGDKLYSVDEVYGEKFIDKIVVLDEHNLQIERIKPEPTSFDKELNPDGPPMFCR